MLSSREGTELAPGALAFKYTLSPHILTLALRGRGPFLPLLCKLRGLPHDLTTSQSSVFPQTPIFLPPNYLGFFSLSLWSLVSLLKLLLPGRKGALLCAEHLLFAVQRAKCFTCTSR